MTELATTTIPLHPRQVSELQETRARLEGMLGAAPYIRNQLTDGGALVQKQIRGLDKMLDQAPQPYAKDEVDAAVNLEVALRTRWLHGMPTQEEMRRNPSGAVDKNRAWMAMTKNDQLRWKHVRRRLHASGISEHRLADEGDISNIEMFRPSGGAQQLNMHNEQIPGRMQFGPTPGAGPAVVMSEDDKALLEEVNPELAASMATLSNEQRDEVLALVHRMSALSSEPAPKPTLKTPTQKGKRRKMKISAAESQRRRERMLAMHAAKRAAKAQEQPAEV